MEKCRVNVLSPIVVTDDGGPRTDGAYHIGTITMRKSDLNNNRRLLAILKKEGFLASRKHLSSFNFDGDDRNIFIDYKGYPVFELQLI